MKMINLFTSRNRVRSKLSLSHAILVAVAGTSPVVVQAQPLLEIATLANGGQAISTQLAPGYLGGQLPALSYGFPPQGPGLSVRPAQPMICAVLGHPGTNPLKKVVFDPNGYFAPIPLASESFVSGEGSMVYGSNAFLRASETIDFASSAFVTVSGQTAFDIDGVRGYCFLVPQVDTQPASPTCTTSEGDESVFGAGFEAISPGSIEITATSQLQPPLNNELQYQYVIRAVDGSVFDIRLREQFPFFSVQTPPSTLPTFGKSLALEENWSCRTSSGGKCDARGSEIDGAGYIHLDGARLEEGACLKITTSRDLRVNGVEQNSFSGRLHLGAIYTTAPTSQLPAQTTHTSIRQPFASQ